MTMKKSARDTRPLCRVRNEIIREIIDCKAAGVDVADVTLDTLGDWLDAIVEVEGDDRIPDPVKNDTGLATGIMQRFDECRDLYTILDLDEHCKGGVRMVGQVHIMRNWTKDMSDYKYIEAALWLELEDNNIEIKDAVRLGGRPASQNLAIRCLLEKHMDELLKTKRWWGDHPDDYDLSEETGWTQWLEAGGLVVIKQTL